MPLFTDEYNRRKDEIDAYISLLTFMSNDNATIEDIDGNRNLITPTQIKVSKASCYLIMYNLVEATVMNGITRIYERIHDEGLQFENILESLRKVWWHARSESIASCGKNILFETVYEHFCDAISSDSLDFKDFVSGVSGNLDANGIRNVCHKYGIRPVSDGRDLGKVKQHRNWLAHGNKSFSEIGQDATVSELKTVKDKLFIFLDEYVENVDSYLEEKLYHSV